MAHNKIGLALGSGSARGWAHIGIIRALEEQGIKPDIITGCSIGSLVGAAYAGGHLDILEAWVGELSFVDVVRLLDVKMSGGLIEGDSLMDSFRDKIAQLNIEELPIPYGAVATDLNNGREIWLQQGSLPAAVRASIALPGLFSPVEMNDRWLVDGGLTNPVPVSLCRAMGADVIIAVNLNSDIVGKHMRERKQKVQHQQRDLFAKMMEKVAQQESELFAQMVEKVSDSLKETRLSQWFQPDKNQADVPGLFEVMASAINIMQDRITKSRMAGDPPDVLLSPRLGQLGLLEFDRAEEAIAEGYDSVRRMLPAIQHALESR